MSSTGSIQEGTPVYGSNDQLIGNVEASSGQDISVNGQRIPRSSIAKVAQDRIILADTGSRYMNAATTDQDKVTGVGHRATSGAHDESNPNLHQQGNEIHVPVSEERLDVQKRQSDLGEVEVRKTVETEQQSIPVDLRHDEVHVEQRDITDRPLRADEANDAFKEGTVRVPVRGEEAVVTKEAYVTGEVVIDKDEVVERQQITDTVRRERVDIDENYQKARSGFQQHFNERSSKAGKGRTWDEAESNYRLGYETAHDESYADRQFEDVEGDLRRRHETSTTGKDSGWEQLREEVREGWNRARGR